MAETLWRRGRSRVTIGRMHFSRVSLRVATTVAVLLAVSAMMSACGQSRGEKGDTAAAAPVASRVEVLAASGLEDLLNELVPEYERAHPSEKIQLNLGGSQALSGQIDAGAHVDLFISADPKALIDVAVPPRSRTNWICNRLVLVAPAGSTATLDSIVNGKGLIAVGSEYTAIGGFTRLALRKQDVWDQVRERTLQLEHVRAVMEQVVSGGAIAGVVYATDAAEMGGALRTVTELSLPAGVEATYALGPYTESGQSLSDWLVGSEVARAAVARRGFQPCPGKGTR